MLINDLENNAFATDHVFDLEADLLSNQFGISAQGAKEDRPSWLEQVPLILIPGV